MCRFFAILIAVFSLGGITTGYGRTATPDWNDVVSAAEGQTVYWHAWGGDENVNRYVAWVADQVREAGGRTQDGRIDLLWLNGENFAALKSADLLYGPFTHQLPYFAYVDILNKPTTLVDFTLPTDGLEAPWGMAQIVFFADTAHVKNLPRSCSVI